MPSMKKMTKTTIGKKKQFNTNTTNISSVRGPQGPKGWQGGNPTSPTMGAGQKPGGKGKAMGTAKGRGGRSY